MFKARIATADGQTYVDESEMSLSADDYSANYPALGDYTDSVSDGNGSVVMFYTYGSVTVDFESLFKVGDRVRKVTAKGLSKYLYVVTHESTDGIHVFIQTTGGTGAKLRTPISKLVKVSN